MALHTPTLRGQVIQGPPGDLGSVAFGSSEEWFRAHRAVQPQKAIRAAIAGTGPAVFVDGRGCRWNLTVHKTQGVRRAAA